MIGRQQQVIAVVDHHVERRVVIGPAAPPGLARRLVHDDGRSAIRQTDRGCEPGEPGPNDVDLVRHQMKAWRRMIHNSRARGRWIGRRGDDQPRATRLSRINR